MLKKFWIKLRQLFFNKQFLRYFLSGCVATVVDLGVFYFFNKILGQSKWYFSNFPAIVASILAAYILNRIWVFESKQPIWSELLRFCGGRLVVSLIFQYAGFYLVYNVIGFQAEIFNNMPWAKAFALVLVIIGNYLVGKFFVFTDLSEEKDKNECEDRR